MQILLAADSNVNYTDDEERCALHYCCENGNSKLVQLIVAEDAVSLNKVDVEGKRLKIQVLSIETANITLTQKPQVQGSFDKT